MIQGRKRRWRATRSCNNTVWQSEGELLDSQYTVYTQARTCTPNVRAHLYALKTFSHPPRLSCVTRRVRTLVSTLVSSCLLSLNTMSKGCMSLYCRHICAHAHMSTGQMVQPAAGMAAAAAFTPTHLAACDGPQFLVCSRSGSFPKCTFVSHLLVRQSWTLDAGSCLPRLWHHLNEKQT